jgi:hypothetical protein
MSSFPGDTKEQARLVGESGVQDAGTRASTGMIDRLRPRCSSGVQTIIVS